MSGKDNQAAHVAVLEAMREHYARLADSPHYTLTDRGAALDKREALTTAIAALTASPQAAPEGCVDREALLQEYVADYEFLGETEDGRDACYTPNERERLLIEDAIRGWDALEPTASPQVQGVVTSWRNSLAGCLGLAEEGGDAKVSYAIGVLDKIAEELAETCQQGTVAVKYEARKRPKWDDNAPWSKWEECTREAYELCLRQRPDYGEWRYEARAVYASPQVQGEEAPFAHYFRSMDGNEYLLRGPLPSFAQSDITPLYATPQRAPGVDPVQWLRNNYDAYPNIASLCDALQAALASGPSVEAMVNRFLGWPLPKDFAPDCGISFDGRKDDEWNKGKTWPIGTNLLSAEQAKAMFAHCLASGPSGVDGAREQFTTWFCLNYPGPHTIISDPTWHAPRIFRQAEWALRQAAPAAQDQGEGK